MLRRKADPVLLPEMVRTALAIGDRELAERLLGGVKPRATNRWERFSVVPEHAFALLGHGRCLLRIARPSEAAHVLRRARQIFDSLGAAPVRPESEGLLRQATAASGFR